MRAILVCLPLLFLAGCQTEDPPPATKEPGVPSVAKQYLLAQAEGDWQTFCQLLAPREQQRFQAELQKSCLEALQGERGRALQKIARGAKLGGTKRTRSWVRVDLLSPSGSIWVQDNRVFLQEP